MTYSSRFDLAIFALLIQFLFGCSTGRFREIPEYKLSQSGDFAVSDSPQLWKFFETSSQSRKIQIDLIIRNLSEQKNHFLQLDQVTITANEWSEKIECTNVNGTKSSVHLKPGSQARIVCEAEVQATNQNKLAMKDTRAYIKIPTDQNPIQVDRLFRIEEFQ